jgi:cytochrome P450 family 114
VAQRHGGDLYPRSKETAVTVYADQTAEVDVVARLYEPDVLDDPAPLYAWIHENLPVSRHRSGAYFLARHADVRWMYQSEQLRAPDPGKLAEAFPRMARYRTFQRLGGTVTMANPPKHTRLRRLVTRDFTVKTVISLLPAIEQRCDALLDQIAALLRAGQVVDLHGELIVPFAQSTIYELIGIDKADRPALTPLVARALHACSPAASDEDLTAADEATGMIEAFYAALIPVRRARPRDDLISAMVAVHDDDEDRLSHDELMSWLWGLWVGGFETTSSGLGNAIFALLRHRDQAHWLRGGRAEVRAFFNETLRYRSASHFSGVPRVAAADVDVSGVAIKRGSEVRAMPGCANRDPAVFPDPDRFDPARDNAAMLPFGHGIHYCVGANLVRAQAEILLPRLHTRFPALTLAGPPVFRRTPPLLAFDRMDAALDGQQEGA